MSFSKKLHILFYGLLARLLMLCYGQWQDTTMVVKFTDVDYYVFHDAANFTCDGESPFKRATYRYTPLLAWLLTPNIWVTQIFGKCLFIAMDLLAAYMMYEIVDQQTDSKESKISIAFWLFNPLTITISCRGNAESIMVALLVGMLLALSKKKVHLAAILYGLSVHFKIYPIIYMLSIFLYLGDNYDNQKNKISIFQLRSITTAADLKEYVLKLLCPSRLKFFVTFLSTFVLLTSGMYCLYGRDFLEHTYFYHLIRKDVRHNFSVYFYMLYLDSDAWQKLLCFFSQFFTVLMISLATYQNLTFSLFLLTYTFVSFNKVTTSQYFIWYISYIPLLMPFFLKLSKRCLAQLTSLWGLGQCCWLMLAYLLEFKGIHTFLMLWAAGLLFFSINIFIVLKLIHCFQSQKIGDILAKPSLSSSHSTKDKAL